MTNDDLDLREYLNGGSEAAFRRIVDTHSGLVNGVASRMTRDASLAEEITQSVFTILARKADKVPAGNLPGWLYQTAVGESRNAVRKAIRRDQLSKAYMNEVNRGNDGLAAWDVISPVIDEAISKLSQDDRKLVVLRFFEQCDYREISKGMGCSEQACRKRSERALARLGEILAKKGVRTSGHALVSGIAAFALVPSSASAANISSIALTTAATSSASMLPAVLLTLMTTKKAIVLSAAVLMLAAVPVIRASKNSGQPSGEATSSLRNEPRKPAEETAALGERTVSQKVSEKIDWNSFFRKLESASVAEEGKLLDDLQKRLDQMSNEELFAAMDGAAQMKMKSFKQGMLLGWPANTLSSRDPMLILNLMTEDQTVDLEIECMTAYEKLLKKDPLIAAQWLDQKIEEGFKFKIDPNNGEWTGRFFLEGLLIASMRERDSGLAMRRVLEVPEDQRAALLFSSSNLDYNSSLSIALDYLEAGGDMEIVRAMIQSDSMNSLGYRKIPEDFEKARKLFERIPDEDLRNEAEFRLQAVSELIFESVPLDLLLK